jgi:hypothetical protein
MLKNILFAIIIIVLAILIAVSDKVALVVLAIAIVGLFLLTKE